MITRSMLAIFALIVFTTSAAFAVTPDEVLADPALEARAREISQALRCVVCQNQSIDDSNAPLAKDLRVLVRERLKSGDSNDQAVTYIVARYGNFVLLKPPMQGNTIFLWFGPAILLVLAVVGLLRTLKSQQSLPQTAEAQPLSQADEERLARLMRDDKTT